MCSLLRTMSLMFEINFRSVSGNFPGHSVPCCLCSHRPVIKEVGSEAENKVIPRSSLDTSMAPSWDGLWRP